MDVRHAEVTECCALINESITYFTPAICYEGINLHDHAFPLTCTQCREEIARGDSHVAMMISAKADEKPAFEEVLLGSRQFSFAHAPCWLKRMTGLLLIRNTCGVVSWKIFHKPKQPNTWPFIAKAYTFDKETYVEIVSLNYQPIYKILRTSGLMRLERNGNTEPEAIEIWL